MNLSSAVIDGVVKLIQKRIIQNRERKTEESVIRVYNHTSPIPEKILYESKVMPGLYLDEADDKFYTEANGKLSLINI